MTKRFCDICGKESVALGKRHKKKYGKEYESFRNVSCSVEQAFIEVTASFGFSNHETGFGGPPDLCTTCILYLLDGLKSEYANVEKKYENPND